MSVIMLSALLGWEIFAQTCAPGPCTTDRIRGDDYPVIVLLPDIQNAIKANSCTGRSDWEAGSCSGKEELDSLVSDLDNHNVKAVICVGDAASAWNESDPYDPNSQAYEEWRRLASYRSQITNDKGVPFMCAQGNHDLSEYWQAIFGATPDANAYDPNYPVPDLTNHPTAEIRWNDDGCADGDDDNLDPNSNPYGAGVLTEDCGDTWAMRVDMGGWHQVILGISCGPDSNELGWARGLLDNTWTTEPILGVNHEHYNSGAIADYGTSGGACSTGEDHGGYDYNPWDDFVKQYPQRFVGWTGGHYGGNQTALVSPDAASTDVTATNIGDGESPLSELRWPVVRSQFNYQSLNYIDGAGGRCFKILQMSAPHSLVSFETYCPGYSHYFTDNEHVMGSQPTSPGAYLHHHENFADRYGIKRESDANVTTGTAPNGPAPKPAIAIDTDKWTTGAWRVPAAQQADFQRDPNSALTDSQVTAGQIAFRCRLSGDPQGLIGVQKCDGTTSQWGLYLDAEGHPHWTYGSLDEEVAETDLCDGEEHIATFIRSVSSEAMPGDIAVFVDNASSVDESVPQVDIWSANAPFVVGGCNDGSGGYQYPLNGDWRQASFSKSNWGSHDRGQDYRTGTKAAASGDPDTTDIVTRDLRVLRYFHGWLGSGGIHEWWPSGHPSDTASSITGVVGNANLEPVP